MEVYFLDKNFLQFKVVDAYISLLWIERYNDCGEFELLMPMTDDLPDILATAKYAEIKDSDETMIVENIEIESDVENGDTVTVSGRSLLAILDRRVVANRISGNIHPIDIISKAYVDNVQKPNNPNRRIPNLSSNPKLPDKTDIKTEEFDFLGEKVLELVTLMCDITNTGCKIRRSSVTADASMIFEVYAGKDRSYNQASNPPVVFSPSFDNLLTSDYLESHKTLMNTCVVVDSGSGANNKSAESYSTSTVPIGIDRKEVFLKSDLEFVSELPEGASEAQKEAEINRYLNKLKEKGREELLNYKTTTMYDGELISSGQNEYGRDYFMGDIVSFRNAYGMESTVRITEITRSYDASGITITPVFTSTEEEV